MYRLKCSGNPILNCIQFYREVNLVDILLQRPAFVSFSDAHLVFGETDRNCVNLIKDIQKNGISKNESWRKLKQEYSEYDEGMEKLETLYREVMLYFEKDKFSDQVKEETFCIMIALILLLSRAGLDLCRNCDRRQLRQAYLGKALEQEQKITFGSQATIKITPRKEPYGLLFCPKYPMKDNQTIQTYTIQALTASMYGFAVLHLLSPQAEGNVIQGITLRKGEYLMVNVIDNTVVAILPNCVQFGEDLLKRNVDRSVDLNGKQYANYAITSIAVQEKTGLFLWADDGKVGGSYCTENRTCGRYVKDIVEVGFSGDFYYLLSADGMLTSNDPDRAHIKDKVASVEMAKGALNRK